MANVRLNSTIMFFATLLSRFLGIFRSRFFSAAFGLSYIADGINFAFKIPNNLRKIFSEGALTQAVLPLIKEEDNSSLSSFISLILSFLLIIFSLLLIIVIIFSKEIVLLFSQYDDKTNLISASLLPYFIVFLLFISFSCIFSAILVSKNRFLIRALSPICFSLAVIFSLVFLSKRFSYYSFAIGTIIGGLVQFFVCYSAIARYKLKLRFTVKFTNPKFCLMFKNFIKASATALVTIVSLQITYYLASGLEVGALSALDNAIMFYQLPFGIFVISLAEAYFPSFSKNNINYLSKCLVDIFTFMIPSCIAVYFLSSESIAVLLQTGAFTLENTLRTSQILQTYMIGLIFMSTYTIFQRYFQANLMFNTVLIISIITACIDIILTIIFLKLDFKIQAIPLAFIFSYLFSSFIFLVSIKNFKYKQLFIKLVKIIGLNIPLLGLGLFYKELNYTYYYSGSNFKNLIILILLYLIAIITTLVIYYFFKVDFFTSLKKAKIKS